jgi:hypothetical protein
LPRHRQLYPSWLAHLGIELALLNFYSLRFDFQWEAIDQSFIAKHNIDKPHKFLFIPSAISAESHL